ncbi:unnamed protein product [marine sediment metagenome]|uniref:Uncharacterized protein n=2 Tax=marine sediment metagenome TaxID=412755 RepID=X1QPG4_9ZZZZ
MSFMERSARHFVLIKAARELKKEIEQAGVDNLKILVEAGTSIVGTYLNGCSAQEKAQYRRDLNALLQMGITADTILTELARQMPEIAPIIEGKEGYKKGEIEKLEAFVREEAK